MKRKNTLIFLSILFAGGSCLAYELVFNEILFYVFDNNTYSVATLLALFMGGLAIGGYIVLKFFHSNNNKDKLFALMQLLLGLYAIFVLSRFNIVLDAVNWLYSITADESLILLGKLLISTSYLIIPTILMGISFPLISSLLVERTKNVGKSISGAYSLDIIGGVIVVLLCGFLLLPRIEIVYMGIFIGSLNFISSLLIKNSKYALFFCIIALAVSFFFIPSGSSVMVSENFQTFTMEDSIYSARSPYGDVNVVKTDHLTLFINKRAQCYSLPRFASETELANKSINSLRVGDILGANYIGLNIGLGCGLTLGEMVKYDYLKGVDVVEINENVVEACGYFSEANGDVLNNPKVNLIIGDGFEYLKNTDKKYDVILLDVERASVVHSSPLFTVEAFDLVLKHLNENGIFGLWWYMTDTESASILYCSLKSVFEYVYLTNEGILFFASDRPLNELYQTEDDIELEKGLLSKPCKLNSVANPVLKYMRY